MQGVKTFEIRNRRVTYSLTLRRNITVIRGDSGTGKTTLYDMVADYTRNDRQSGVTITRGVRCAALVDIDWRNQLEGISDAVVFVDEGSSYVTSEDFASALQGTDNYYVIFSREPLHQLPYSVDEIYQFKNSGKRHRMEPVYKARRKRTYGASSDSRAPYAIVLTEDSKSGYQFYASRFEGTDVGCESAYGKSNVFKWLRERGEGRERVFVIADGAAFGSEAERVLKLQERRPEQITICLPESFEWLLLASGVLRDSRLAMSLDRPSDHVDPSRYISWERYFTALLEAVTKDTPFEYSKGHLAKAWLVEANADKVMELISTLNVR